MTPWCDNCGLPISTGNLCVGCSIKAIGMQGHDVRCRRCGNFFSTTTTLVDTCYPCLMSAARESAARQTEETRNEIRIYTDPPKYTKAQILRMFEDEDRPGEAA